MTRPNIFFTAEKTWLPHTLKGTANLNYSQKTASLCSPKLTSLNTLVYPNITRDITLNLFKCISIYNNPASGWKPVYYHIYSIDSILCSPVSGKLKSISNFLAFIFHYLYIFLLKWRLYISFFTPISVKDNQSIN